MFRDDLVAELGFRYLTFEKFQSLSSQRADADRPSDEDIIEMWDFEINTIADSIIDTLIRDRGTTFDERVSTIVRQYGLSRRLFNY